MQEQLQGNHQSEIERQSRIARVSSALKTLLRPFIGEGKKDGRANLSRTPAESPPSLSVSYIDAPGERKIAGRTVGIVTGVSPSEEGAGVSFTAAEGNFASHAPLLESQGVDPNNGLYFFWVNCNGYQQRVAAKYELERGLERADAYIRFVDPNRGDPNFGQIRSLMREAMINRFAPETRDIKIIEEIKSGNSYAPGEFSTITAAGNLQPVV